MRRVAAVVTLVVLASAVGAESIIKAVQNANLPKGSVTVEEVETVVTIAEALNSDMLNAAVPSHKSTQDLAYAIH
jgi:hypothetical protein